MLTLAVIDRDDADAIAADTKKRVERIAILKEMCFDFALQGFYFTRAARCTLDMRQK